MQTKAPIATRHLPNTGVMPIIEAYFEFSHLKQLYRQGWLQRGIPAERCESVAEHSFGVALLALFLAEAAFPDLDTYKVMRMALLHDFGEIYAGDITPADGVRREKKRELEQQAVQRVLGKLPDGAAYIALWEEYERGDTPEARFVRQIDRLEMVLQASVYEHQNLANLAEFFESVRPVLATSPLQTILQSLEALRRLGM
jgi:putative hydrolase of HD superfamily